ERARPEAKDLKLKIESLKKAAIQAAERLNYSQQEIGELKERKAADAAELKRQEKEIAKYAKEKDALAAQKDAAEAQLGERDAKLTRLRDTISSTTGRAADVQRELAHLKIQHEKARVEVHETRLAHERASERKTRLTHAIAEADEAIETQRFELRDVDFTLKESGAAAAAVDPESIKKDLFAARKKEAEINGQLRELDPALRRLQSEYSLLKAQADSQEKVAQGYNRAV